LAILWAQEIGGSGSVLDGGKAIIPSRGPTRQNDITGGRVLANENFLSSESKCSGKSHCLTAAIGKQLGGLAHGVLER